MADEALRETILAHLGPNPVTILELSDKTGIDTQAISRAIGIAANAGECLRIDMPNPKHERGNHNTRPTCKGYVANGLLSPIPEAPAVVQEVKQEPTPLPVPVSNNSHSRQFLAVLDHGIRLCDSIEEAKNAAKNMIFDQSLLLDREDIETLRVVVAEVIDIGAVSVRWEG